MKKLMLLTVLLAGMVLAQGCGETTTLRPLTENKVEEHCVLPERETYKLPVNAIVPDPEPIILSRWQKTTPEQQENYRLEAEYRQEMIAANARNERELERAKGTITNSLDFSFTLSIGLTAQDVLRHMGQPNHVNRSTGSWGVHEQWCYNLDRYLYFENGILTSWQN